MDILNAFQVFEVWNWNTLAEKRAPLFEREKFVKKHTETKRDGAIFFQAVPLISTTHNDFAFTMLFN